MKKLMTLLLALVLILSMIPMTVSAAKGSPRFVLDGDTWYEVTSSGKKEVTDYDTLVRLWWDYCGITYEKQPHEPGKHTYGVQYNTRYHWLGCSCGTRINVEPHVDPKDAPDDLCTCGYRFSDNADLVTLWVDGCQEIKNFNKNTTEYTLKAFTYKDVKEVKIATRTFDSQATVELPEDLTLKEGTNIIPVKVIAENQKVVKTYTLTILKESK